MAEILLDSDVIIAWLRGSPPSAELIPELLGKGDVLTWTPVSVAEIFAGLRKGEEDELEHKIPLWTLNRKHYPMRDIRLFAPPHR